MSIMGVMLVMSIRKSRGGPARPGAPPPGAARRPPPLCGGGALEQGELAADDGALGQDVAAEAVELGRAATCGSSDVTGFLHQLLLLDQATEVLLVQQPAGQRLHGPLQLAEREVP